MTYSEYYSEWRALDAAHAAHVITTAEWKQEFDSLWTELTDTPPAQRHDTAIC